MIQRILLFPILFFLVDTSLYDDDDTSRRSFTESEEMEFQPVSLINKDHEKIAVGKNLDCDDFTKYVLNCTLDAALIHNSKRKTPPMPANVAHWCKALRHLTNCAIDWNSECKEMTDSHFNEESIKGHLHVINHVCDDEWFLSHYDDLPTCIEAIEDMWEACYTTFKLLIEEQKNKSYEWTHYEIHFYMCCARAQFRRCTLDSLYSTQKCSKTQADILQKFSIIVSEGDVYQDCDSNMMYSNCPGGDPRPSTNHLTKLVNMGVNKSTKLKSKVSNKFVIVMLSYLIETASCFY